MKTHFLCILSYGEKLNTKISAENKLSADIFLSVISLQEMTVLFNSTPERTFFYIAWE